MNPAGSIATSVRHAARIGSLMVLLLGAFSVGAAQSPEVLRVEPPNWWAGHSINPVRLLIRGRNLFGAKVETDNAALKFNSVRANSSGTYLFAEVSIDAQAKPGKRTLKITTAKGTTAAPFEISAPLDRATRFQGFATDDVIYLIMTDRFSDGDPTNNNPQDSAGLYDRSKSRYYHGGDFQGIINHLSYLKDLGVTAIWLTPWYDNVNHLNEREQYSDTPGAPKRPITDYHGYGAVDFYRVEEHFGSLAKLRELVDAAHRLGIKVIQDQVANHTGPYHPWVKDSPTPTWYNGTEAHHLANKFQTWVLHDPHPGEQMKRETLDGWFIDILPDLNQGDEETARYIIQNTLWWIGVTGIDAIRQDTWQYVPTSFWRQWMTAIKREYPKVNVVGEVMDGDPTHVSFFEGGRVHFDGVDTGLDMLFDFPLAYPARRAFAEGKPLREVAQILAQDQLYARPGMLVTLLGNHDMPRFMGEPGASVAGLNLANTFMMTTRGTPQIYYGDEIAMAGAGDPDNRRDFPGGFPGDSRDAFKKEDRTAPEESAFEHLRKLARLRAEHEALRRGSLVNLYVTGQQYAYARVTARESIIVVINNDSRPVTAEFNIGPARLKSGAALRDSLGVVADVRADKDILPVAMPARAAAVFITR